VLPPGFNLIKAISEIGIFFQCSISVLWFIGFLFRCFRTFVEKNYKDLKSLNPKLPILIRECSGVQPQMWARYGKFALSLISVKENFDSNCLIFRDMKINCALLKIWYECSYICDFFYCFCIHILYGGVFITSCVHPLYTHYRALYILWWKCFLLCLMWMLKFMVYGIF
jgi:hypothetical protein